MICAAARSLMPSPTSNLFGDPWSIGLASPNFKDTPSLAVWSLHVQSVHRMAMSELHAGFKYLLA